MAFKKSNTQGFTIVEVAVIVPMLIATVLVLFNAVFVMIQSSTNSRLEIDLVYDTQQALKNIENDSALASTFIPEVEVPAQDPYPPSNGPAWKYTGTSATDRVLIAKVYSTTVNPSSSNRKPVFVGTGSPTCDAGNIYLNDVLQYTMVYFVKNNNLYRRKITIPPATTATCVPQFQKTSCPTVEELAQQGITPRSSTCGADDEILLKNVSSFSVNYYDSTTNTVPLDVYAVGADVNLVKTANVAEIVVTTGVTSYGKLITNSVTYKINKINMSKT